MPVAGLSTVLENMVMSVMKTHCLKTWNLFHEENGNLTFRLRFEQIQESPIEQYSDPSRTENHRTISFKKKNTKQILRDKSRSRKRRKVRQSVSSIESNRGNHTGNHTDNISNFGLDIQANEEDFLESTRHNLDTPVLEELFPESDDNRDISLVNNAEVSIEVPPSPENSEKMLSQDKSESSDDDDDDQYSVSEENEIGNRLCGKLDELLQKMDSKLEEKITCEQLDELLKEMNSKRETRSTVSSDSDSDT